MQALDQYIPDYQFSERHLRDISAAPEVVLQAILSYRADSDPFFRIMIGLRELPMRLHLKRKQTVQPPPFGLDNFVLLQHQPGKELAFGLAGKFWQMDYGLIPLTDNHSFLHLAQSGIAKLVLGFQVEQLPNGVTRLHTETRVYCPDTTSKRRFTPYWYLIRPVSGLIRRRILARIAKHAAPTIN